MLREEEQLEELLETLGFPLRPPLLLFQCEWSLAKKLCAFSTQASVLLLHVYSPVSMVIGPFKKRTDMSYVVPLPRAIQLFFGSLSKRLAWQQAKRIHRTNSEKPFVLGIGICLNVQLKVRMLTATQRTCL